MLFVVWIPLVLQVLVALGLLAWLAFGRAASRTEWLLRSVLVACCLMATGVGGLWLILPWYTPVIYAGLFLPALLRSQRRWQSLPAFPSGAVGIAGTAMVGALLVLTVALAGYILTGWRMPADAVELSFPFRSGTYLVVNGGGNELINAHYKTLEGERFRPWRGQSYGVDIEELNSLGFRARGFLPANLSAYEIFGEPVYAPPVPRGRHREGRSRGDDTARNGPAAHDRQSRHPALRQRLGCPRPSQEGQCPGCCWAARYSRSTSGASGEYG